MKTRQSTMTRIDRCQDRVNAALSPLKLYGNSTII